jgi:serine protease Do
MPSPVRFHRHRRLLGVLLVLLGAGAVCAMAQDASDEAGWMGLYIRDLDQRDIQALHLPRGQRGVVVSGVDDDGPASMAGIEPGDVITALDGRPVAQRADFVHLLGERRAGELVRLLIVRRNASHQVSFELQARPRVMQGGSPIEPGALAPTPSLEPAHVWLALADLDDADLAAYFDVAAATGVLVLRVVGESLDRLRAGDVILECDGVEVASVDALRRQWSEAAERQSLELRLMRRGRTRTVRLGAEATAARLAGVDAPGVGPHHRGETAQAWERMLQEIDALRTRLQALEAEVQQRAQR